MAISSAGIFGNLNTAWGGCPELGSTNGDSKTFLMCSDSEESACSAGELGLIPGLGRFPWRRA